MRVDINSIECSTGAEDGNGATWWVTEISGWWGIPVVQQLDNPTGQHGAILGESKYGPRSIGISGITKAPSESAFWASIDTLLAQTSFVLTPFPITVHEGTAKTLDVLLAREQRIGFVGKNAFEWELELAALDPFKDGDPQVGDFSGAMMLTNAGNGVSYPVVTIGEDTEGVVLTNASTGQTLELEGEVPQGTVVDFEAKTITGPGGEDLQGLAKPGYDNWWYLLPGDNSLSTSAPGTIEYRETWQ